MLIKIIGPGECRGIWVFTEREVLVTRCHVYTSAQLFGFVNLSEDCFRTVTVLTTKSGFRERREAESRAHGCATKKQKHTNGDKKKKTMMSNLVRFYCTL